MPRSRNDKVIVTWDEFDRSCRKLARKLKKTKPDLIVGLGRGGAEVGVRLSHLLDVSYRHVHASHYLGDKRPGEVLFLQHKDLDAVYDRVRRIEHVCVVDDLVDTAFTIDQFSRVMDNEFSRWSWTFGVLYEKGVVRHDCPGYDQLKRMGLVQIAERSKPTGWIEFPYERKGRL